MPNWCSNFVTFYGENAEKVAELFDKLIEQQKKDPDRRGVKPEFIEEGKFGNPYMFEVMLEEYSKQEYRLRYDTKWAPNTQDLVLIADKLGCNFTHDYEELGMQVYGRANYESGNLNDTYLDEDDFKRIIHDEKNDVFILDGEEFPSEFEALDVLLDKKENN